MGMANSNDQVFGSVGFALGNGASKNWSTTGAPSISIDGYEKVLTARASAASATKDSVTGKNAPAVRPLDGFAVTYTAGFTGANDALSLIHI